MSKKDNDINDIDKTLENITKNLFKKTLEEEKLQNSSLDNESINQNSINSINNTIFYHNPKNDDTYTNNNIDTSINTTINNTDTSNNFFEKLDEEDSESRPPILKILNISVILILIISIIILTISLKSLKEDLNTLKIELDNKEVLLNESILNSSNLATDIVDTTDTIDTTITTELIETTTEATTQTTTATTQTATTNSNNTTTTEYTIQEGDNLWKISISVYGSGEYYQKILDANNMTEDDMLIPGETLIIPAID